MPKTFEFRPHHFLCALSFQGKGYSSAFVQNFQDITHELRKPGGEKTLLKVTLHTDHICAPCPHRRGLSCTSQEKISLLDKNHQQVLQLKEGDILTWKEAKEKIRQSMTLEKFHQACESCQWKPLGLCEAALKELNKK